MTAPSVLIVGYNLQADRVATRLFQKAGWEATRCGDLTAIGEELNAKKFDMLCVDDSMLSVRALKYLAAHKDRRPASVVMLSYAPEVKEKDFDAGEYGIAERPDKFIERMDVSIQKLAQQLTPAG